MVAFQGQDSKTLKFGDTAALAKELKEFISDWEIVFNDGAIAQPFQGHTANNYEFYLEDHQINIRFRPETGAEQNVALLLARERGKIGFFDFQFEADADSNEGLHVEGMCKIRRNRVPFAANRQIIADVTLLMAGTPWTIDADTS